MAVDGAVDRRRRRRDDPRGSGNGNGVVMAPALCVKPNTEHKPDSYDDLQSEFGPLLFSYLEHYLPPTLLSLSRQAKIQYMMQILRKYFPDGERTRAQRHGDYRQRIAMDYQRLNREIDSFHPANFFVPSFLKAISENEVESFKSILSEPAPGIYTFEIFQPRFCDMLLSEVENVERWVRHTKFKIMRPNIMNKHGAVLNDFGLESMLKKLMDDYVRPLAEVFFPEVGGSTLDSHHGFIVEYGVDKDVDLGNHVDDAEVTLNVCLGRQFSGGELVFGGVRCDKHVTTEAQSEEIFEYAHVPGHAVLHRGRHRHWARATTAGTRSNLILWSRSSAFRELRKYQTDFSSWCGECKREKRERQQLSISSMRMELLKRNPESTS